MSVYLIAAPGADVAATVLPVIRDGYLGFAGTHSDLDGLALHLRYTFGPRSAETAAHS